MNRTRKSQFLLTCSLALAMLFFASPIQSATIWVDAVNGNNASGDGSPINPVKTIGKGMAKTQPNDTIEVRKGQYIENLILGTSSLTIRSVSGRDSTTIRAANPGNTISFVGQASPPVELVGFRIQGGLFSNVQFNGYAARIAECAIDTAGQWPIKDINPMAVDLAIRSNSFAIRADGKYNGLHVRRGNVYSTTVWPSSPPGFSYYISGAFIKLSAYIDWTIESGAVLKLADSSDIRIEAGRFTASNVTFTSSKDDVIFGDVDGQGSSTGQPGQWRGITFFDGASNLSSLQGCTIKFGGGSKPAITYTAALILDNCSPLITECTFISNNNGGVDVRGSFDALQMRGNTFRDNAGSPVRLNPESVDSVVLNNTFVPRADRCYATISINRGQITHATTWPAPPSGFFYYIPFVSGAPYPVELAAPSAVWTIAPNSVVKLAPFVEPAGIRIRQGTLIADQVVFTSSSDDTIGYAECGSSGIWPWGNILIDDDAANASTITNSKIKLGAVVTTLSRPTIANCTFTQSHLDIGFFENGDRISGNQFLDQSYVFMYPWAIQQTVANNIFVSSGTPCANPLRIKPATVSESVIWPAAPSGLCYNLKGALTVSGSSALLSIRPGTVIKCADSAEIRLEQGKLVAAGAVFTSESDDTLGDLGCLGFSQVAPGQWRGINILQGADDETEFVNCIIRGGGRAPLATGLTISNDITAAIECTFSHNAGAGLQLNYPATGQYIDANKFFDNQGFPISLHSASVPEVISDNSFVGGTDACSRTFLVTGGECTGSDVWPVPQPGFCYAVRSFSVANGASLKILPETILKFASGASIRNEGQFVADGALFTSLGDDTLGTIHCTVPGVYPMSRLQNPTTLRNCVIRNTASNEVGVILNESSAVLENCLFEYNDVALSLSAPVTIHCNKFSRNRTGILAGAAAIIRNCEFIENTVLGIDNRYGTGGTVDAVDNWWGHASGPNDASSGPPDSNPIGLGDKVTDYVAYRPWLLVIPPACQPPHLEVKPDSLLFQACINGQFPASKTLTLSNTGFDSLIWSLSTAAQWLSFSQMSGTENPAEISVTVNTSGLSPGLHSDSILISAPGADNSPRVINVRLTLDRAIDTPPVPMSPAGGDTVQGSEVSSVIFSWGPLPIAEEYQIQVASNPAFQPPALDQLSTSPAISLTLAQAGVTYYWRVRGISECGFGPWSSNAVFWYDTWTRVEEINTPSVPVSYSLSQNYPNPFNPVTAIEFALPRSSHVTLEILDILGRHVATLVDEPLSVGLKRISWNGRDDAGRTVASGIYLYRLKAGAFIQSRKMILLR